MTSSLRSGHSDAAHVAHVRRQLGRSKLTLYVHMLAFIFFVVMFVAAWIFISRLPELVPDTIEGTGSDFIIGLQLGAGAALIAIFAIINAIMAIPHLKGQRTARLLLEFHDQLKEMQERPEA